MRARLPARHRAGATLVALLALVVWGGVAAAQERPWNPYGTEVYREGPGVKFGTPQLVFHPGAVVEGGYDSNVFFTPDRPVGSGLLRVRLHLDLASAPPVEPTGLEPTAHPKVEFRIGAQVEYREYLSRNAAVSAQRSINAIVSGFVTLFPKSRFSLRIDEDLIRSVDPRNGEGPQTYARIYNRAGINLTGRPGSGRLEIGVSDHFIVQHFEDSDVQFGNMIQNEAKAFARFKLLTRTIVSVVASVGYVRYAQNALLEAIPVRAYAEVSSPITSWLEGTLMLGYGNSLSRRAVRFNSAISQEEARFLLPLGIRISVGHRRDFYDSLFASFFVDDAIYLMYQQPFVKYVRAYAQGAVRFRKYGQLSDPMTFGYSGYSSPDRDDIFFDVHAGLNVQARSWLSVGASYNLLGDHTSFAFVRNTGENVRVGYIKHTALASVDFAY